MYLVDTNVISAGAPSKGAAREVLAWMDEHAAALFLSVVSIEEIEDGIAKLRREGARRRAEALNAWLETLLHLYSQRVLILDVDVARATGALSDKARGLGLTPGFADLIIAATAAHHGLTLLTRNTKDFSKLGVALHDPFMTLPR